MSKLTEENFVVWEEECKSRLSNIGGAINFEGTRYYYIREYICGAYTAPAKIPFDDRFFSCLRANLLSYTSVP